MDIISAAVLCSTGTATATSPAGVALAPLVVNVPQQPHEAYTAPSITAVSTVSTACKSASSESQLQLKPGQPKPLNPAANALEFKEDATQLLHHRLSLSSLHEAPELTADAPEAKNGQRVGVETRAGSAGAVPKDGAVPFHVAQISQHNQQVHQSKLAIEAIHVLRTNDLGGYTIPATGLYPYQWNWDSALVSMGWSAVDEHRAWEELEKLFSAQWVDGMVPHIVFHKASPTYFPGPEIWGYADKPMKSTGITQPPIAATAVRRILENQLVGWGGSVRSGDEPDLRFAMLGLAEGGSDFETSSSCSTSYCKSPVSGEEGSMESESWTKAAELFPKLMSYHRWFYAARDPEKTGLVATLHPWESGMDNSPAWDVPLGNVPVDDIPPYTRRDLGHVDAAMRPHKAEYDRYLTLLYRFRGADYDPSKLYWLSPFRVSDICTNSLLHRANLDLRWLAISLNRLDCAEEIDSWLEKSSAAFNTLWDEESGIFRSQDQLTGKMLDAATSGGFLPLFAHAATPEQAARLAGTLESWLDKVEYGVPSLDPTDARFEGLRYWRGPVWAIVNFMIVDGLRSYGYSGLADRIETQSLELVQKSGLYEYYDPLTGRGAGGNNFSWTAAMVLSWLDKGAGSSGSATPEVLFAGTKAASPLLASPPLLSSPPNETLVVAGIVTN